MSVKTRGFASMPKDRQLQIASQAGKKAHELGRAHKWTKEEASKAGKISGMNGKNSKKKENYNFKSKIE